MGKKFLDSEILNYTIKNLVSQIDKTFLKKNVLFNVTPAYYRLFDSATDNPSDKLTVIDNDKKPTTGEVTSDTVRSVTKNPTIYAVGSEVVFIEEVITPKFDNIKGITENDLKTLKADTKNNRQNKYNSNILFVVDDTKLVFYDRTLDTFTDCTSGEKTIPNWEADHDYVVGDKVNNNDIIYKCIKDHHSDLVDFKNDEDNWIIELDKYFSLSKNQYDQMVTDGLITNDNKELFIVNNGTDISSSYEESFVDKKDIQIQHNLKCKYPMIRVFDTNDNELYMDIEYYSDNLTILHSEIEISGKVIVNKL